MNIAYTTGPLCDSSLCNAPVRWLGSSTFLFNRPTTETDDRLQWNMLGQSIFTPKNHLASNPSLNDRPYAGWLYTGLELIQNLDDRQLTSLDLLGGIVGPWPLGRQVQNNVRALFGLRLASDLTIHWARDIPGRSFRKQVLRPAMSSHLPKWDL